MGKSERNKIEYALQRFLDDVFMLCGGKVTKIELDRAAFDGLRRELEVWADLKAGSKMYVTTGICDVEIDCSERSKIRHGERDDQATKG